MNTPSTIRNAEKFETWRPAGWDGWFHWEFLKGCWPNPKDTPQDFDFVKERRGQFLVIETKEPGAPIPQGQFRALFELHAKGNVTVMFLWGKMVPSHGVIWFANSRGFERFDGIDGARDVVSRWWQWADTKGACGVWKGEAFDSVFPEVAG